MSEQFQRRPLPREVYMRRRIAAVAVLVLILCLLWWLISAIGGSDEESDTAAMTQDAATTSTTPDMTSPHEPPNSSEAKESKPSESSATSSSAKPEESSAPGAGKDTCALQDLVVTAQPGAVTFNADKQPNFFAKVHNPTKVECKIDLDKAPLKFEVFTLNNYQRVWSDVDCNDPEVSGEVTIPAGKDVNYELGAWSRTGSAPNQCSNRPAVQPGAYLLYAHVGDNVSQPATFNLQ